MREDTPLINPIAPTSPEREEAQRATERVCTWFIVLGASNWFIMVGLQNILPLYAHLEWNTPESQTGVLLFIVTLFGGISLPIWIHACNKFGFGLVLTYTFIPSAVCSLVMGFSESFIMMAIFFSINGAFNMSDEVTSTLISVVMPRSLAEEWVNMNVGMAQLLMLIGLLSAGVLYEYVSTRGVFWLSAAVSTVSFVGGLFTLVGKQAVIENKQIEAYQAHARANGHTDETQYAPGITHERDEFPIVLQKYDAYAETFDFWNLSRFEILLFSLLTFVYAYFLGSMALLFVWWPLFVNQKWGVGPVLANAQLIFEVVLSALTTVAAPFFIDFTVNLMCGRNIPDTDDEEATGLVSSPPPSTVAQNDRDRVALVHFALANMVAGPCWWIVVVTPITFEQNWILIGFLGVSMAWGMVPLITLSLRFQRAGDNSQILGIQGFFWQLVLAILHLSVGAIWAAHGYKAMVYIPVLGNAVSVFLGGVLFVLYGLESSWNKANVK